MRWAEKDWWQGTREIAGVEYAEQDGNPLWHFLLLIREDTSIKVLTAKESLSTAELLEQLAQHKTQPVVITVGADFSLSRLLAAEQAADPAQAMLGANAAGADFAVQSIPADAGRSFASVVRTDFLEQVIAHLQQHKTRVLGFVINPAAFVFYGASAVKDWMNVNYQYRSPGTVWYLRDGFIAAADDLTGKDYALLSTEDLATRAGVSCSLFPAWCAVIAVWTRVMETGITPGIAVQAKDLRKVSLLQRVAALAAILLLTTAVLLFGLQWYGNRRKSELERAYMAGLPVISAIDSMKSQVASRADLLGSLGGSTLRPTHVSKVLDRVGALVPEEVQLTQLIWSPTTDELKKLDQDSLSGYNLILRGAAGDSWPVSRFSNVLEKQDWVKRVNVLGSEMNFRTGNHEFTFLLKVEDAG